MSSRVRDSKLRGGDPRDVRAQHRVRTLGGMKRDQSTVTTDASRGWGGWARELAELAAVFVTVGAAHLLANLLGHQENGPVLLIGVGVALVTAAATIRAGLHRRASRQPRPGTHTGPRRGEKTRLRRRADRHRPAAHRPGTLWRIRTTVDDAPGSLALLCTSLSRRGVNILSVELHPLGPAVADELIVDAPPGVGAADLVAAVADGHGRGTWASRADVHDLTDLPARVLGLAARVAADPEELPAALRDLYRGATVIWIPERGEAADLDGTTMRVPEAGGWLVLSRPELPFSPAELARARALAELATARAPAPDATGAGGS
jgi:hypothetical protein